jgi:predicted anti-sigma-YlaC factor YlaD
MGCETWREALSARLDGEPFDVGSHALDAHLDACAECSAYATRLDRLHRATRVAPAVDVPDLTDQILAAAAAAGPRPRLDLTLVLRWVLVVVAALEIGLASPEILGRWHTGGELGTWAIASAVGFLSVALKPRRAGAVLPMLVCATIFTVFVSLRDLTDGRTDPSQEWSHLLLVVGALVLTGLWRRERETEEPGPDVVVGTDRGAVPIRSRRAA